MILGYLFSFGFGVACCILAIIALFFIFAAIGGKP